MQSPTEWHRFRLFIVLFMLSATMVGCRSTRKSRWRPPLVPTPDAILARPTRDFGDANLRLAEAAYARAFDQEESGSDNCVDEFYRAAALAWPAVEREAANRGNSRGRAEEVYHSALTKLIVTAYHYGRIGPGGLAVRTENGRQTIPIALHGFPGQSASFDALIPVGEYSTKKLSKYYSSPGLGVATVALRSRKVREPFRKALQAYAVTVVLRPVHPIGVPQPIGNAPFAFDLIDPLRISHVTVGGRNVPLRRDLSAPLAYRLKDENREYIRAFLQPGTTGSNIGLFMIEPYQPGKIPLVFVHGLLSDPFTWANIANEVLAQPDLMERYQIWGFEYATGEPFLQSAAMLRHQLQQIQSMMDPGGTDPAMSQIVLIGHSMGGLVAKLQITSSGSALWQSVSHFPVARIKTTPNTRKALVDSFFFEPSPLVSRIVYIGTPHRGSPWARRPIGRIGSSLVEEPSSMGNQHRQLVRDNPDAFSGEFTRRMPTSIDLLRPDSPQLQAIERLPIARYVRQHSIIGSFRPMIGAGDSDGVVPVASAVQPGVLSEKLIFSRHEKIHQSPEGIAELLRILRQHVVESGSCIQVYE